MVKEIDGGMTEPIIDTLLNDGGTFDGSTFSVALELVQIGGAPWLPAMDYAVGDLVRPTGDGNGRLYECIVAGTSDAGTEPAWSTIHGTVMVDGTAQWQDITPHVTWYIQAVGQVVITDYHRLPPNTSYRTRYVVTDTFNKTGAFPNKNQYNVWRIGAVMAG